MADPRFPIGKFSYDGPLTAEQKQQYLNDIEQTPARFRAALAGLSDSQLNTPYRDGGWTPRQLAHHLPDSHMNSYIRFKLALTEDERMLFAEIYASQAAKHRARESRSRPINQAKEANGAAAADGDGKEKPS